MVKAVEDKPVKALNTALQEIAQSEELPLEEWPLETLRDYRLYNEEARKRNKKARKYIHEIKQCPVELHPKQRIKFGNNDKTLHPIPVFVSNHLIHFDKKLIPGQTYELPECIISYLAEKGYPVWDWVTIGPNGERETRQVGKRPRFSLTTVWQDESQWLSA